MPGHGLDVPLFDRAVLVPVVLQLRPEDDGVRLVAGADVDGVPAEVQPGLVVAFRAVVVWTSRASSTQSIGQGT